MRLTAEQRAELERQERQRQAISAAHDVMHDRIEKATRKRADAIAAAHVDFEKESKAATDDFIAAKSRIRAE